MAWKYKGKKTIKNNQAWTDDDGIQHPANWNLWSDAEKKKRKLSWEDDPVIKSFDNRFYHGYQVGSDGKETNTLIPKSLADEEAKDVEGNNLKDSDGNNIIMLGLKSIWITKKKAEANDLLHKTDWYVIRAAESVKNVPASITKSRADIRSAMKSLEDKINACDSLDKFIALFQPKNNGSPSDMDCFPKED
jgi:hypothetical protein